MVLLRIDCYYDNMGTATQTSSPADSAGYGEAKEVMRDAVEAGLNDRAVDIAVTAALAAQPNGPSKLPLYTYAKYTATFVSESNENGVQEGVKAVGRDAVRDELSSIGGEHVVEQAQDAVASASEKEIAKRGISEANKNLGNQAKSAANATVAAIISNGADALNEERASNE